MKGSKTSGTFSISIFNGLQDEDEAFKDLWMKKTCSISILNGLGMVGKGTYGFVCMVLWC